MFTPSTQSISANQGAVANSSRSLQNTYAILHVHILDLKISATIREHLANFLIYLFLTLADVPFLFFHIVFPLDSNFCICMQFIFPKCGFSVETLHFQRRKVGRHRTGRKLQKLAKIAHLATPPSRTDPRAPPGSTATTPTRCSAWCARRRACPRSKFQNFRQFSNLFSQI